ncbi:MAG: LysM peptidoglycan-binding domain-containing protein [Bacteroidota bacterium]
MKHALVCFTLFGLPMLSFASTGDSLRYLTPKDTIFLSLDYFGEKIFHHTLEPKQTLFSLARFYGLSLGDLYAYNPGLKELGGGVSVGEKIRIPIPNRAILRSLTPYENPAEHIPVIYRVKKGDTVYRITKRYFKISSDTLLTRNGLNSIHLSPGQELHVGFMHIGGIPDSLRQGRSGPFWAQSSENKLAYRADGQQKKEQFSQGIAHWNTSEEVKDSELVVLHRSAPLLSYVAVTNPMFNRTVYAKVIGRVPRQHGPNVVTVITPTIAKMLGAIDPNFYVQVRYFK